MSKSPSDYYKMDRKRASFLSSIRNTFSSRARTRYHAGQKEHGGDLWLKATYPMLGSELVDAYVYYQTHRVRMRHWLELLTSTHPIIDAEREAIGAVISELRAELGEETSDEILSCPDDRSLYASDS